MRMQPGAELGNVEDGEYEPGGERAGERQDSPGTAGFVSGQLRLEFVLGLQCPRQVG